MEQNKQPQFGLLCQRSDKNDLSESQQREFFFLVYEMRDISPGFYKSNQKYAF